MGAVCLAGLAQSRAAGRGEGRTCWVLLWLVRCSGGRTDRHSPQGRRPRRIQGSLLVLP